MAVSRCPGPGRVRVLLLIALGLSAGAGGGLLTACTAGPTAPSPVQPSASSPSASSTSAPSTPAPSTPAPSTSSSQSSAPAPSPSVADVLTIVVDDGSGTTTTWQLSCDPPGGTHPDPDAACRALEARGRTALPAVARDRVCSQVYGGAQTATVSGRWQGRTVRSSFSLRNGCEISRWKMLEGLLPPAGA